MHTKFWREILKTRDHLENAGEEARIILKQIFKKWDGES